MLTIIFYIKYPLLIGYNLVKNANLKDSSMKSETTQKQSSLEVTSHNI